MKRSLKLKKMDRPEHHPQREFEMENMALASRTARFLINEMKMGEKVSWWGSSILVRESVGSKILIKVEKMTSSVNFLYKALKQR